MNYAEAIAVLYAYPFIITLVAPWVLGEHSRLMSWIGITIIISCGVLVARSRQPR